MIKHILVPTDLSKNSREAFLYAIQVAKKLRASITLYHAWSSPMIDPRLSFKEAKDAMGGDKEKAVRRLKSWCAKAGEEKVTASYILDEEPVTRGIVKLTKTGSYELLIMGTKGAGNVNDVFMGSNAADVIASTDIPVMAVPSEAMFSGFKNIVFAVDYQDSDMEGLRYIEQFSGLFRSKITAVHVSGPDFTSDFERFMMDSFSSKVSTEFPGLKMEYKLVKDDDVIKGLEAVVHDLQPDLLVMVTEKRSFLGEIFWRSLTKQMAFRITVPLLAIPHKSI